MYESTANELRDRIVAMIRENPEVEQVVEPFDLFKHGLKCGDLSPTLFQAGWALREAKRVVSSERRGFTLIELLVVVLILLALASLVVLMFRADGAERARSAARTAQSAFLGARDRANHARDVRGLRLIVDPQTPELVTSFVYVQRSEPARYGGGQIRVERPDQDGNGTGQDATQPEATVVRGFGTDWLRLQSEGFLEQPFFRVKIPIDGGLGSWYAGTNLRAGPSTGIELFDLTTPLVAVDELTHPWPDTTAVDPYSTHATMLLGVRNEILPDHQPISLPSGIVIDLRHSSPQLTGNPDIMFSPRGPVAGPLAAQGALCLMLRDIRDAVENIDPRAVGADHRSDLLLTIWPATGHVQTYPVDLRDADGDGLSDDVFGYAKIGSQVGG